METKIPIKTSNPLCGLAMMHETPLPGGKTCLMSTNPIGASVFMLCFTDAEKKTGTLSILPADVAAQIKAASTPAMDESESDTEFPTEA
jgi:hypothetical protein